MAGEWNIQGKVCIVTGANSGIGRETALQLVKLGAGRVILACRNLDSGKEALSYIRKEAALKDDDDRRVAVRYLDLASLDTVRQFAKQINEEENQLHVLVNNAGVVAPMTKARTKDGFELTFGTNHLGHFLLTLLLLDLLKRSAPSRIVILGSVLYILCWPTGFHIDDVNYDKNWWRYNPLFAYGQSKLANILFARALEKKLNRQGVRPSGITVYAVNPGPYPAPVNTDIDRYNRYWLFPGFLRRFLARFLTLNATQGAETPVEFATKPGVENDSGKFFSTKTRSETLAIAKDDEMAERLWELSERMVGLAK